METSELTGAALDWAVQQCEGQRTDIDFAWWWEDYSPSTNWAQGGAIIERDKIDVMWCGDRWCAYTADAECTTGEVRQLVTEGATPLIAAMRGYVASKQGEQDANETV